MVIEWEKMHTIISDRELIQSARKARERAYAPYSDSKIGAALFSSGKLYTGFNIENASYSLSICAERVAAINALLDNSKDFQKIAIVSGDEKFPYPCGACCQFLSEFARDMEVILVNGKGNLEKTTLKELIPKPFIFSE